MYKSKSGGSLPGVEHKPKKMKQTHSGTRKYHRGLDLISMKEYINEKKRTGIYTLIHNFFEPYASKGACTVPKGYNFTLINRLYRERLLFLGQGISTDLSNQLIGLMMYLSMEDENKELYLFVNSPGGWVIPGIAIYDTMQFVRPDIHGQ
ncbi:hypothetical protein H5410_011722 [Solanum commersonii]|uniref:ATP-dependent Clp protease proteolytic subunit n=1 Tax=Solanum commersonii TaxID=4109 RepID=A0A9J6APC9_SOLCO|nr:hypothetical protein H5410_011722 [Solanum commersonii]